MGHFETLDHTADTAIHVEAETLGGLIETATRAMFTIMFGDPAGRRTVEREMYIEGDTPTDLLWGWLSDALAWSEVDRAVFWHSDVEVEDGVARGSVRGDRSDELELAGPPIKAVTYHGLDVLRREDQWEATIVFDV